MRSKNLTLKRLRTFYVAAKCESLRGAASSLGLTVSAVSLQISALERELETKVLQRVGNAMRLTRAGSVLLLQSENIFRAVDDALNALPDKKQPRGRVAIAISSSLVDQFASPLALFIRQNPDVELAIQVRSSNEVMPLVARGTVDFGLGFFSGVPPEIDKSVIERSGYIVLSSPHDAIGAGEQIDLRELAKRRLIVLRNESGYWVRLKRRLAKQRIEVGNVIEAGNCSTAFMLASAGIGVAIVHASCVTNLKSRKLRRTDITRHTGFDDIALIAKRRTKNSEPKDSLRQLLTGQF